MTTAVTQWEQLSEIQIHNFLEQKEIDCVDQLLASWNLTRGGVCMHCLFDKLEKKIGLLVNLEPEKKYEKSNSAFSFLKN